MVPYIEAHIAQGGRASNVTRHMLGLFQGQPGARAYRRHLATEAVKPGAGAEVLANALALVRDLPAAEAA
jgi:tRNA-dihydrouridine synthase A